MHSIRCSCVCVSLCSPVCLMCSLNMEAGYIILKIGFHVIKCSWKNIDVSKLIIDKILTVYCCKWHTHVKYPFKLGLHIWLTAELVLFCGDVCISIFRTFSGAQKMLTGSMCGLCMVRGRHCPHHPKINYNLHPWGGVEGRQRKWTQFVCMRIDLRSASLTVGCKCCGRLWSHLLMELRSSSVVLRCPEVADSLCL